MIVTDVRTLGALVRKRRQELGWPQARLAKAAGVSRPWISEFETGKTSVEIGLVFAVLEILGLRVNVTTRNQYQVLHTPLQAKSQPPSSAKGLSIDSIKQRDVLSPKASAARDGRPPITKDGKPLAAARVRQAPTSRLASATRGKSE